MKNIRFFLLSLVLFMNQCTVFAQQAIEASPAEAAEAEIVHPYFSKQTALDAMKSFQKALSDFQKASSRYRRCTIGFGKCTKEEKERTAAEMNAALQATTNTAKFVAKVLLVMGIVGGAAYFGFKKVQKEKTEQIEKKVEETKEALVAAAQQKMKAIEQQIPLTVKGQIYSQEAFDELEKKKREKFSAEYAKLEKEKKEHEAQIEELKKQPGLLSRIKQYGQERLPAYQFPEIPETPEISESDPEKPSYWRQLIEKYRPVAPGF